MEQVLLEAVSRHEEQEESQEKPTPSSTNSSIVRSSPFASSLLPERPGRLTLLMKIKAKKAGRKASRFSSVICN